MTVTERRNYQIALVVSLVFHLLILFVYLPQKFFNNSVTMDTFSVGMVELPQDASMQPQGSSNPAKAKTRSFDTAPPLKTAPKKAQTSTIKTQAERKKVETGNGSVNPAVNIRSKEDTKEKIENKTVKATVPDTGNVREGKESKELNIKGSKELKESNQSKSTKGVTDSKSSKDTKDTNGTTTDSNGSKGASNSLGSKNSNGSGDDKEIKNAKEGGSGKGNGGEINGTGTEFKPFGLGSGAGMVSGTVKVPQYPKSSENEGREGEVIARVLVKANGSVENVSIFKKSGDNRLDEMVGSTIRQNWRFKPLNQNYYVDISFNFSIKDRVRIKFIKSETRP